MLSFDIKKKCDSILEEGCKKLGLSMGVVSNVKENRYEISAVYSDTGVFVAGESFPLGDTFCRDVVSAAKTVAITEIEGVPGMQLHPLYHVLALEAYISTPIFVNGSVWGTLNFSSMRVRPAKFNDEEIKYVESLAAAISVLITAGMDAEETSVFS